MDDSSFSERQARQVATQAEQLRDGTDSPADVRRCAQQPFLEQPDNSLKLDDIAVVSLGVGLVVARDLLACETTTAGEQIVAVARQEIVSLTQHDLEPVPVQLHVLDDL